MQARRQEALEALGVMAIVPRNAAATPRPVALAPESPDWGELADTVRECRLCGLCETRTQTVFGVGDRGARLMVVGEAPGAEEDRQGEPFVGRAGILLNAMLRAAGFERREVFIANVLKCRPPQNRDPSDEEAERCLPYLRRQIELVSPSAILCVGRIAAQRLLGTDLAACTPARPRARPRRRAGGRDLPPGVPVALARREAQVLGRPQDRAQGAGRRPWPRRVTT